MDHILIATDASPDAREAVDFGLDLARTSGAKTTVVYVRRAARPLMGDPFYQRDLTEGLRRADEAMRQATRSAAELGVTIETEILEGDPATRILELARSRAADLIVLGSRNRGPVVSALLGSVSKRVVEHADGPVLVAHARAGRGQAVAPA